MGSQATKKRVKITDGWGGPRHVLFQACREVSKKHCWGFDGGGAGPNIFCTRTPKLAERGVKNTAGVFGEGPLHWSQNHQACRDGNEKHCWGCGEG